MDSFLDIFLLIMTLVIVLYYIYEKVVIKNRTKSQGKIPIPGLSKTNSSLGNLGDVKLCGSLHKFLERLHGEFGNVASFYWRNQKVISMCDHESYRSVKHLFNRPALIYENFVPFIGENCIQFANGIEGRDRRKCYDRSFNQESLMRYVKVMEEASNQEIKQIEASSTLTIESAQSTALTMAIKTILQCFIAPDKTDSAFFRKMIDLYSIIFDGLTDRLINDKLFTESDNEEIKFQEAQKEFQANIADIVTSRMSLLASADVNKKDALLIDDIIYFHGESGRDLIVKEVSVYMIAGFHTTGNLFSWCLYHLAKHPEYQDLIFSEIVQHKALYSSSKDHFSAIGDMVYLRACINETLRISELATFSARVSNDDISMGSFLIPANTPIVLALGVSLSDAHIFKNSDKFDPNRFVNQSLPSLGFVPFGFAGKRKCPGEGFSYLEVSVWLIQFVKRYRWCLQQPEQQVGKVYGIVTHMDRPVPLLFSHR